MTRSSKDVMIIKTGAPINDTETVKEAKIPNPAT